MKKEILNICGTIILFNPNDDVVNNIESYILFLKYLIVIDNSENVNQNLKNILQEQYCEKIIYIQNNENLGIAKALNLACEKGIELHCDWILTMDQDSRFVNFEHYLRCLGSIDEQKDVAVISAHTTRNALSLKKENPNMSFIEKFIVITSGNLVNLELYPKIGGYDNKLFIDMVDYDFCAKVRIQNLRIFYFEDVLIEHAIGEVHTRKNILSGKIRQKIEHNHQRAYYIARNSLYLAQKYHKLFPDEFSWLKTINILFIHEVIKILLYEPNKWKKIKAKLIGLWHFLINKYGKYNLDFK